MRENTRLWALQLVNYFLTKGYVQLSLVTSVNNGKEPLEGFWLYNRNATRYKTINIHDVNDQYMGSIISVNRATFDRLKGALKDSEADFLEIGLGEAGLEEKTVGYTRIALVPNKTMDPEITAVFPEISTVIFDVENTKAESAKLSNKAFKASAARFREMRKGQFRDSIVGKLCPTFFIPAIISVIVFAAIQITAAVLKEETTINSAIVFGAYYKAFVVVLNQWWRLLTSGFVHVEPIHLLCNLYSLFYMAKASEENYGTLKAFIILIVSSIFSYVAVFIGQDNTVVIGLSGGIYGLLGASLVYFIRNKYYKVPYMRTTMIRQSYLSLITSLLPSVSMLGHLGGLVCGIFLGIILSPQTEKTLKINTIICGVLLVGVLVYMVITHRQFVNYYYLTDREVADIYGKFGLQKLCERIYGKMLYYYLGG